MSAQEDYGQNSSGSQEIPETIRVELRCPLLGTREMTWLGLMLDRGIAREIWPGGKKWKKRYTDYRNSTAWKRRRLCVLRRANNRCEVCNSKGPIDIHHLTYERVGNELLTDLVALCWECHEALHKSEDQS